VPAEQPARRVELTAACAAVENWLGHNEQAHRRLMDAWAELPDCRSPEAATLEIELLVDGLYRLDFDQVLERGKLALETARPLERPGLTATAAAAICFGATSAGRIEDAFHYQEEAAGLVDKLSDAELAPHIECLYYLSWAECFLERNEDATRHVERGIAISRATGDGRMLIPLLLTCASTREFEGQLGEALELCEEAVEAARLTDNPQYLYWALWEVGWRHYLAGEIGASIEACEQSARSEKRLTGTYMRSGSGEPGWTLGLALIKDGQLERGYETMVRGVGEKLERVTPREHPWAYEHLAMAELAMGRLEDAEAHVRKAEESAEALAPLHLPVALAARPRAELLLASGDADAAVRHATIAVERSEASGVRLDTAWTRLLLGRALAAAGERGQAVENLRQAEAELDRFGSLRERDAARRELRRLGARRETRGTGGAGDGLAGLTAREREIADLVTDRKTNREIAAALFVSDKTVESHLRNIFGKLGVSSRVDVARQVERERNA
jgi:ATP/maltotriose-dependent transcriptional regulator MalT